MSTEATVLICYRSACTNGAHVCGYNRVTHGLYCIQCAIKIHRANSTFNLFPLLNNYFEDVDLDGGSWAAGLVLVRDQ